MACDRCTPPLKSKFDISLSFNIVRVFFWALRLPCPTKSTMLIWMYRVATSGFDRSYFRFHENAVKPMFTLMFRSEMNSECLIYCQLIHPTSHCDRHYFRFSEHAKFKVKNTRKPFHRDQRYFRLITITLNVRTDFYMNAHIKIKLTTLNHWE